jgi:predicted LPLAT superfamily acyltransferase
VKSPSAPTAAGPAAPSRKPWSSQSIGSRFQHSIFYGLIRFGGRRAAYLLLRIVVLWYVLMRPSVRRRSRPYLSRRFPGHGILARLRDSYLLSLGLGEVLVDRAALGILGPDQLSISMSERARLQELLREGKGLVLVTAHVGCWQVAMAALGFIGTPVNLLIHHEEGDLDRHYFEHRGESPYRIIDPTGYLGGTLEMMGALKRGEVLCVMGDRAMGSEHGTLSVDFLGDQVRLPVSPYKLAGATGAPVAVIFPKKVGPSSYALHLARVLRVDHRGGRSGEPYRSFVQEFARALEDFAMEHPYQFFNFFDMWRGGEIPHPDRVE